MKYSVTTSENPDLRMTLEYSQDGFLRCWKVEGLWPVEFWRMMWSTPPLSPKALLNWQLFPANIKVEEIPEDLSFERFWEEYSYKVGNKKAIEKQFNALPESDKIAAFKAIPRYHRFLSVTPIAQAMASTWLKQERWTNDYSLKRSAK